MNSIPRAEFIQKSDTFWHLRCVSFVLGFPDDLYLQFLCNQNNSAAEMWIQVTHTRTRKHMSHALNTHTPPRTFAHTPNMPTHVRAYDRHTLMSRICAHIHTRTHKHIHACTIKYTHSALHWHKRTFTSILYREVDKYSLCVLT